MGPSRRLCQVLGTASVVGEGDDGVALVGGVQSHVLLIQRRTRVPVLVADDLVGDLGRCSIALVPAALDHLNHLSFHDSAIFILELRNCTGYVGNGIDVSESVAFFASSLSLVSVSFVLGLIAGVLGDIAEVELVREPALVVLQFVVLCGVCQRFKVIRCDFVEEVTLVGFGNRSVV